MSIISYTLLAGRITTVTGRNPGFRGATAGYDDLRTIPLLDYRHAARPGRGRGEYHKVRSNPNIYDGAIIARSSSAVATSRVPDLILPIRYPVTEPLASGSVCNSIN
jgi:hypothetical protein